MQRPRTRDQSQDDPPVAPGLSFLPVSLEDGFLFGLLLMTLLHFMNFFGIKSSIVNVTYSSLVNSRAHCTKFGRSQKVEKNDS